MKFKIILSLVVAVLVVIFIVQNVAVVDIKFLFWKLSISRSLMMFFLIIVGIIIGWLLKGASFHRKSENVESD
ncbi:MAG: LapA family protein [Candidatus Marinimicrobia bacterium]|nr:LapA family protein [Candidatus Neomarinimicrobiota bacterium]